MNTEKMNEDAMRSMVTMDDEDDLEYYDVAEAPTWATMEELDH